MLSFFSKLKNTLFAQAEFLSISNQNAKTTEKKQLVMLRLLYK